MKLVVPPPLQGLAFGVAMWLLSRALPAYSAAFVGQKFLAGALIITGLASDVVAVCAFFKARTTVNPLRPANSSTLVNNGLYRYSRNPMYLGLLAILTGWAIWLANPLNLILLIGFIFYITEFQIKPEEQVLQDKFSTQYADYCRQVRRWI